MRNKDIEKSLKRSLNQAPALDFKALMDMPFAKMERHDFITVQEEPLRHRGKKYLALGSLCTALLLLSMVGWYVQNRIPNSIISLDVNPSIEIITNRRDQVLSVKGINKAAQQLLEDQDYNMAELNDTVNSIVTETIDSGYLSVNKNVILVSVENKNIEKATSLAMSLDEEIKSSALEHGITPQVLRQTFTKDKDISAEAKKLSISVGKLRLIHKVQSLGVNQPAEELATMSIKELLALITMQQNKGHEDKQSITPRADQENREENRAEDIEKDDQEINSSEAKDRVETSDRKNDKASDTKDRDEASDTKDRDEASDTKERDEASDTKDREKASDTEEKEKASDTKERDKASDTEGKEKTSDIGEGDEASYSEKDEASDTEGQDDTENKEESSVTKDEGIDTNEIHDNQEITETGEGQEWKMSNEYNNQENQRDEYTTNQQEDN